MMNEPRVSSCRTWHPWWSDRSAMTSSDCPAAPTLSGNDAVTEKLRIDLGQHHRSLLPLTIPQALDWAATTWSGRVALSFVHAPDVLTYRQLAESVTRLRTGLVSLGLRPSDRVGIMVPNQVEFPLAWLSVIDAGAVAVPLNPTYTRREIEFILGDTGAKWLITTSELLSKHETATFAPVPGSHVVVAGDAVPGTHRFGDLHATPREPRHH